MISELSDRIWGRLGLAAVQAVPLEEPRAPSAEAAVTELRPRGAAWTRELRLRPLPGQQVFTIDAMRLLVDRLQDLLAIRLPFLAKVSFQILLTRPAVNDEDEDEDRVELTHYFLRLAPWIVRPASPSARAGTMMAAIRTKFEVALERSRFPQSDCTVVGITAAYLLTAPSQQLADMPAPPPPNEAGGCWKELPETLAKKKAIWNPQNEDHRCFMWCVLAHCLGVEGLTWQERQKTVSCSGSFFYPEMTRRGRRPVGWQPALADAGVDFSGLPTDRPVNFDNIEAFKLRNAGRVEVFVFVWQQTLWTDGLEYYHVLQQRAPSGTAVLLLLHSGHYSLIHNFQALASRQGLTLGATPTNTGGCRGYKCPRCMARFATKASWQRHRATQCYREIGERARKVPLSGPKKSLLRYRGLTCYADLQVYSTLAPTVHIAQQQPARRSWSTGPPLTAGSASRPSRPPRRSSTTATAAGSISGRCATPATSRPRLPRPTPWSFTTGAATTSTSCCATSPRWALLSAGRRAKSSARTATKRAARARQKAASPRGPWPRLRQRPRPRPRPRQSPSPAGALQAAGPRWPRR